MAGPVRPRSVPGNDAPTKAPAATATKAPAATATKAPAASATKAPAWRRAVGAGEDRPSRGSRAGGSARAAMARVRAFRAPTELLVLALLAAVTRFAFVSNPRAIVFDEVYFRDYALRYRDHSYYFDLHPPLGKLLIAGWAWLFGIDATATSKDPAVALRLLPALAGTLLVVVFYLFLRELTASRRVATLGAALLLLDNAILVESRFILVDSMLLLFGFGALTCFLAASRRTGRAHWVLLTAAAVLAGMAAATKWTGLCALGLIGVTWFGRSLRERVPWRRMLGQGAVLALVPALLYVGVFAVHFALLTHSGPGDAYMSQKFQSTLVGNAHYDPGAHLTLPGQVVEINKAIHSYELSLNSSKHPYSSAWTSWPLMKRPVYYWVGGHTQDGKNRYIYLLGNPVLWWGQLAAIAAIAIAWLRRPETFARHRGVLAFLGVGWVLSYLPFATIDRPMFLYHYFFAFMFCLAASVIGIGLVAGWMDPEPEGEAWSFPSARSATLYWGILAVALAGFLWFLPLTYGLPLSDGGLHARMWLHSWR